MKKQPNRALVTVRASDQSLLARYTRTYRGQPLTAFNRMTRAAFTTYPNASRVRIERLPGGDL